MAIKVRGFKMKGNHNNRFIWKNPRVMIIDSNDILWCNVVTQNQQMVERLFKRTKAKSYKMKLWLKSILEMDETQLNKEIEKIKNRLNNY